MATFATGCNTGGPSVLPSEINLITALGSGGSSVSDTFSVANSSLVVLAVLASGQCTISAKTSASDPITDPASGGNATSVTLVGAGSKSFIRVDSSSTLVYGAVKIVDSNWSSALSTLDILVLSQAPATQKFMWYNVDSMENGGAPLVSTLPR